MHAYDESYLNDAMDALGKIVGIRGVGSEPLHP